MGGEYKLTASLRERSRPNPGTDEPIVRQRAALVTFVNHSRFHLTTPTAIEDRP